MDRTLPNVLQSKKTELANVISILSLASSVPLSGTMTIEQQGAVLKEKLDKFPTIESTLGASGNSFLSATSDAILNPNGYTDVVAAIMDILAKIKTSPVSGVDNKQNVLSVSPLGGHYTSINAALSAIAGGLFGALSNNNTCLLQVYPGIYNENVVLPSYIDIVGTNIDGVVINGSVEKSSHVSGAIANLTVRGSGAAAFTVSGSGAYELKDLRIENVTGGTALLINHNDAIVTIRNTKLISTNGEAIMLSSGKASGQGVFCVGQNGVAVHNGATFVYGGGDIQATNHGIYCDGTSQVITMFGVITAGNCGIKTDGGMLRLFGGVISGDLYSISADMLSTVHMGAISTPPQTQNLMGATVIPNASANSIAFEDKFGLFEHSLATLKALDNILIELGQAKRRHTNEIIALHEKSNYNEHDSLVDAAMLQISLMLPNYTMFMVDSFMNPNSNVQPDGDDKATVLSSHSVLMHQGVPGSYSFYRQDFTGNLIGKTKLYLKSALQKSLSDSLGAHDWQIDYYLEIAGGRYTGNPVRFLLHSVSAMNWNEGRVEKEQNLVNPAAGIALNPLIASNELVSIKIAIKSDSATVDATPVIRSFVAFI